MLISIRVSLTQVVSHLSYKDGNKKFNLIIFSHLNKFTHSRTSPMSVPKQSNANLENRIPRQRQESSSSVSVGSWQMISGTGSLRSQDSNIIVINEFHQQQQQQSNNNNSSNNHLQTPSSTSSTSMCSNHQSANLATASTATTSVNDANTIVDEDCFTANDYFMRRERLNAVRTLFYNCYASTIGYKFKNGNDNAGLGSLLGNFAEKVGLTTQRTSV